MIGVRAASTRYVALVDADVLLPPASLEALLRELEHGGYVALQAGLDSFSDGGYWGDALAAHHRRSRSRWWFCVVATLFDRDVLLQHSLDGSYVSGEDIDLRWRLRRAGLRTGVSRTTLVRHRFGSGWQFAKGQWLADGQANARMVLGGHGPRAALLLVMPLLAAVRGTVVGAVHRELHLVPYFTCYAVFNYVGMAQIAGHALASRRRRPVSEPAGVPPS